MSSFFLKKINIYYYYYFARLDNSLKKSAPFAIIPVLSTIIHKIYERPVIFLIVCNKLPPFVCCGCWPQADGIPLLLLPQADVTTLLSYFSGLIFGSKLVSW
jgi:hypothetical protein